LSIDNLLCVIHRTADQYGEEMRASSKLPQASDLQH
jgi:hypothetical protein